MNKNTLMDPEIDIDPLDDPDLETEVDSINGPYDNSLVAVSDEENLPALSNPALHRYLQEISQYELLTREETDELAVRFREQGDQDAAYRLVSSNLRLVVKVAMDFQKYWMQCWIGAGDQEI